MTTPWPKCRVEKVLPRPFSSFHAPGVALGVLLIILLSPGCQPIRTAQPHPPARLVGTLWWMSPEDLNRPITAWHTDLDQLEALGIHMLVLNGPYVGAAPPPGTSDPTEVFFREADRRGWSIYVDTLTAPDWWTFTDAASEVTRARSRIADLARRYGQHPSFTGYYLPYELYVMWGAQADLITALHREVSAACKQASPEKTVMISPFFILDPAGYLGNFRRASPAEYQQFWTGLLRQTQVDLVALQDSGEHLSCYTLDQRRPFLAAMKAACTTTHKTFWINAEIGELGVESFLDYTNRFGYQTSVNDPRTTAAWRAVAPTTLRQKLQLAGEYTDTAISWGYQQFIRPALGPEAKQLHELYRSALIDRRDPGDHRHRNSVFSPGSEMSCPPQERGAKIPTSNPAPP